MLASAGIKAIAASSINTENNDIAVLRYKSGFILNANLNIAVRYATTVNGIPAVQML